MLNQVFLKHIPSAVDADGDMELCYRAKVVKFTEESCLLPSPPAEKLTVRAPSVRGEAEKAGS